jgi:hypothetical protein
MAEFRAISHAQFRSRRFRVSATMVVTVATEGSPTAKKPIRRASATHNWVPRGLTDPTVKWDALPERVLPEAWTPELGDAAVPGSLLAADAHRPVEGG